MPLYIISLPNHGEPGAPRELFSNDPTEIEKFAKAEDRPGRGVYDCIGELKPGARSRCLETIRALSRIYFDMDLPQLEETREEVVRRLRQLPLEFTWVRDSGSSNLHLGIELREPLMSGTPEFDRMITVWKRLAEKLCADPAPVHAAALIRRPGTHNTKNGSNGLCRELWGGGKTHVTQRNTERNAKG